MYIEVIKVDQCYYIDKVVGCCEAFNNAYCDERSIVFFDQSNKNYDGKFKIIGIFNYFRERKIESDFKFDIVKDINLNTIEYCPFCGNKLKLYE